MLPRLQALAAVLLRTGLAPVLVLSTAQASGPVVVPASQISAGDTAWLMMATALVLLMTLPGLALFYAGMVRKKNVLATLSQAVAICALVSVLWVVVGYSLAFTPGSPWLGSLDRWMLEGLSFFKEAGQLSVHPLMPTVPESVFALFQLTFAIITPALICGAFAERMRFSALLCFMMLWSLLVYAPVAHWVWEPGGWLAGMGALDFAGGTVVHINAGAAGLMAAYMLGRRKGWGQEAFIPHNLGLTMVGAALLWVGWFGFNAGSAGAADGRAGMALLVTHLAAATGALGWMLAEWLVRGRPSMLGLCSGAVAGLVAITPASGFVAVNGALLIGLAAGVACYWGATGLKRLLGADDSLDVWGVHGIGGLVGALLTGVFARKEIGGVTADLATQAIAAGAVFAYSLLASAIILKLVDLIVGLRVPEDEELLGLDLSQHGERLD